MRITGPRIWSPPLDRSDVIRTLKRLRELEVDFVDTADSCGPEISERLIHEGAAPS
jgi:pyridoxine 4-dehydrogenase